jgi:catechol 2,3-dioxygenase-like lactoylglutathione lyase family enzyme
LNHRGFYAVCEEQEDECCCRAERNAHDGDAPVDSSGAPASAPIIDGPENPPDAAMELMRAIPGAAEEPARNSSQLPWQRRALEPTDRVILRSMAHLELVALVVREYDPAIRFFVDVLRFELVEDTPSLTNDGRPKRWVVVRPSGAETGILLARTDGETQLSVAGQQFAGRVGLFLRVEDFDASYQRMVKAGVRFVSEPRVEAYGTVAVFLDVEGNRWDLLGPDPRRSVAP